MGAALLRNAIRHLSLMAAYACVTVGLALSLTVTVSTTASAENPCLQANPTGIDNVQGDTWVATVEDSHQVPFTFLYRRVVTMRVTDVVVGAGRDLRAGHLLTFTSGPCDIIAGLQVGERYLFSTPDVTNAEHRADSAAFAAWRIDGTAAHYVLMHPQARVFDALPSATTVASVIDLVAPGEALPPTTMAVGGTSTSVRADSTFAAATAVLAASLAVLAAALMLKRRGLRP